MAPSASLISLEVEAGQVAPRAGGVHRTLGRIGVVCALCGLVAWSCSDTPSQNVAASAGPKAWRPSPGLPVRPLPVRPVAPVAPSPEEAPALPSIVVPPSIPSPTMMQPVEGLPVSIPLPTVMEPGKIPLPTVIEPEEPQQPVPADHESDPQSPAEQDYALDMMEIPEGELGSDSNILYGFGTVAASAGATAAAAALLTSKKRTAAAIRMAEPGSEASAARGGLVSKVWNEDTKIVFYLAVWFLGSIYYNIFNKKACIALGKNALGAANATWTLAAVQLLVGILFVVPLWATGLRKAPKLTAENWKALAPVGLFASLSHASGVLALGAGAVSFAQIVKAAEPVFAAGSNALILKDIDHPYVYAALIPIIAGVGLASLKELSFTWLALGAALMSNQFAALKNVVSKGVMKKPWAKELGAQNTYAVVTILALASMLPLVALDMRTAPAVYAQVMAAGTGGQAIKYSLLSGFFYYLYNESAFLALSKISPVTHSVANTVKRVVIIVSSCIVFRTPMTPLGAIGCSIAVAGTFFYSLLKKKFSNDTAKAEEESVSLEEQRDFPERATA